MPCLGLLGVPFRLGSPAGPGAPVVLAALVLLSTSACAPAPGGSPAVVIGSKAFTESVVLGEIVAGLVSSSGASAEHRRQLGGTRILWEGLQSGEIDVYPEYTGTIREEILAGIPVSGEEQMRRELGRRGILMSGNLGFNNTYVIGMRDDVAERLGVRTVSDLRNHPLLRLGFGNEFMDRGDGWPSLRARYELPHDDVRGLDHDLAYRGVESGSIDVIDLYSTDAEIEFYGLRALHDDLGHFPEYQAVLLFRDDLDGRAPAALERMLRLEGSIDEARMIAMNARAKLDREPETAVAARFLDDEMGMNVEVRVETMADRLWQNLRGHLWLVSLSLLSAILVAVPLGVLAARLPRVGQVILGVVGVVQTIPSLALFVFMIPFLGIGAAPAIAALFLYSLLPIVRNTHAGLMSIPAPYTESAEALGLSPGARLRLVELPMAAVSILAGIKTSAVINVGTATLAALIGAEGFGQPILTGIRLADNGLIMEGAVPAALLALAVQGVFELAERRLVPRGLRLESGA